LRTAGRRLLRHFGWGLSLSLWLSSAALAALPERHPPGPGWNEWDVAGHACAQYNYSLNENGKIDHHGKAAKDYLGDGLAELAVRFIEQAKGQPFVLEVATFSRHAPYMPAPRDENAFPDLKAPRTPAYNAEPDSTCLPGYAGNLL